MATIVHVVGARPNYVKVAPLWHAIRASSSATTQYLVDTGQHRRDDMTGQFRRDLGLPEPDWSLGVQAPDRLSQIAGVMTAIEDAYQRARPDIVAVVGDVNSTLGAALSAVALGIPVAHLEAGLRSHDSSMPEELNRVATDRLCDLFLTPSRDAGENLAREGIPPARVPFVRHRQADGWKLRRSTWSDGVYVCDPLGYLDFLSLVRHAKLVLTDSGGFRRKASTSACRV